MTSAHIAASTGSKDVMTELTQFNKSAISAKNKVVRHLFITNHPHHTAHSSRPSYEFTLRPHPVS